MRLLCAFFRHREERRLSIRHAALELAPLHCTAVDVGAECAIGEAYPDGVAGLCRGNAADDGRVARDEGVAALECGERIERAQTPDATADGLHDVAVAA